jgi:flagellar motor switch protein FliM
MSEILSQDEIDALLTAVHRGDIPIGAEIPGSPREKNVLHYNFRRPNRVAKDQIRTLQMLHDSFGKIYGSSLSAHLRTVVEVELEAVEQITYSEFIMSLSMPSCITIFNMEPLKGGAVLEINPHIIFMMIDRLLGGMGRSSVRVREFTEIEKSLIERIVLRAMVDLQQAWQHVGAFSFRLLNIETNPQFVQITSPNEVVLVITFNIRIGEVSGVMTLCFPYLLLEPVIPKLSAQRWFTSTQREQSVEARGHIRSEIMKTRLTLRAFLGQVPLTVRDLLALRPGDVVRLSTGPGAMVPVEVEGVTKFSASPGVLRRKKAVQIQSITELGEVPYDQHVHGPTARVYHP